VCKYSASLLIERQIQWNLRLYQKNINDVIGKHYEIISRLRDDENQSKDKNFKSIHNTSLENFSARKGLENRILPILLSLWDIKVIPSPL